MQYLITTIYIIAFIFVLTITVYNILFALYTTKAKNELVVSLPSFFNKHLAINIFIAFLTLIFIMYLIGENIY